MSLNAKIRPVRPEGMPFRSRSNNGLLGATALIVAESMFFVGVLSAWYYLQATSLSAWPPNDLRPREFTPQTLTIRPDPPSLRRARDQ